MESTSCFDLEIPIPALGEEETRETEGEAGNREEDGKRRWGGEGKGEVGEVGESPGFVEPPCL